ncbi:MAG: alpha/beta hydrolase domain-containing protein [Candidatus Promineifilaceae bacterium]|nr:alpha/beta hydrolase domain-containing protein [Candidatus Promineifilaceae bacterium]
MRFRSSFLLLAFPLLLFLLLAAASGAPPTRAASLSGASLDVSFVENASQPFGTFDGVAFVRHTGLFEGETSLGPFRVPYEIIAPADPGAGAATVLMEPPHWAIPPFGRDYVIGRNVIFTRGISYASVGFGTDGGNILNPFATDLIVAGDPVENPGQITFAGSSDEEILIQFAEALSSEPYATEILGPLDHRYALGISQTADVLLETLHRVSGTDNRDLFDITLLHGASWRVTAPGLVRPGGPLELIGGQFAPLEDVGRVIFVGAEGDLLAFDAKQFRRAANRTDQRVYEVAGAAHLPTPDNPLNHWLVARALLVAGDEWVRLGQSPPASNLLQEAPAGQIDPVYGTETGIARDADLNAKGGVRLPDLAVSRAQFIASDPDTQTVVGLPFLAPLSGSTVDLACEPEPGSDSDEPRFSNHGEYVNAFTQQVNALQGQGFLLDSDAEALKDRAAQSQVGKPGTCAD